MAQYSYNPDWASAIASIESAGSGGYSALGAPNSRGSRAYGRYQVMDFNIPEWTERYVGKRLTPEEFLNSPEAQDAVFQGQFGSLVQRYGNERDAASAWFTGRPVSAAGSDTDVHGRYTGASYADAFQKALGNPNVINAGIGSDALVALGKTPAAGQSQPGVLAAGAKPMAMMDTQPQGLLERMGLQRMDPNAQGETAMPFYQRPSFLDFAKGVGLGLSQLSTRPSQAAAQQLAQLQQDRSQRRAANQTLAWLSSQPGGEQFMPLVEAIGAAGALQAYLNEKSGASMPAGFRGLDAQAKAAGLEPGTPEYQEFMLYGGMERDTTPAAFKALQLQAAEAGLTPGTPEYQDFMVTRGAGEIAAARALGTEAAKAQFNLAGAEEVAARTNLLIDNILNDPALPRMIGPLQGEYFPNLSAGAKRFQSRLDQLQGVAFLQAYDMLRGGGQITENEGKKAEDAMLRLNTAQSEQDFVDALEEFRDAVATGINKLRAQAGVSTQPIGGAGGDPLGLR